MPFTCARKIWIWMCFDHRIPPCVLDVSTVILRNRRAAWLLFYLVFSVPGSVGVESVKKCFCLVFFESFPFRFFFNAVTWEKPTKWIIILCYFRAEFVTGRLCNIRFLLKLWVTSLLSSRLKTVDVDVLTLTYFLFLLSGPHAERYRRALCGLYVHGFCGDGSERPPSPVGLVCCWITETLRLPVFM